LINSLLEDDKDKKERRENKKREYLDTEFSKELERQLTTLRILILWKLIIRIGGNIGVGTGMCHMCRFFIFTCMKF